MLNLRFKADKSIFRHWTRGNWWAPSLPLCKVCPVRQRRLYHWGREQGIRLRNYTIRAWTRNKVGSLWQSDSYFSSEKGKRDRGYFSGKFRTQKSCYCTGGGWCPGIANPFWTRIGPVRKGLPPAWQAITQLYKHCCQKGACTARTYRLSAASDNTGENIDLLTVYSPRTTKKNIYDSNE